MFTVLPVGGNHEAINFLWELYYGGWVAPRIFFLGYAGVIRFGGLRIAGLSGIFKSQHYNWGHWEAAPYSESSMRSAYHVRHLEVNRLSRLREPIDIFISHDWPAGIAYHGDVEGLLRRKRFLRKEIEDGSLGSPPAAHLLHTLQPKFWFSAHLHTKFQARVNHPNGRVTDFLSLDKCLPGRQYLQVIEFPETHGEPRFSYDPEWLAIILDTHELLSLQHHPPPLPDPKPVTGAQIMKVNNILKDSQGFVPESFERTAAPHDRSVPRRGQMPTNAPRNPQTIRLLSMLGLTYDLDHPGNLKAADLEYQQSWKTHGLQHQEIALDNPEEIDLDSD